MGLYMLMSCSFWDDGINIINFTKYYIIYSLFPRLEDGSVFLYKLLRQINNVHYLIDAVGENFLA